MEDEDIDAAGLLRVKVSESATGTGKRRGTSFVCKGTSHKKRGEAMRGCSRAQKKMNTDSRGGRAL